MWSRSPWSVLPTRCAGCDTPGRLVCDRCRAGWRTAAPRGTAVPDAVVLGGFSGSLRRAVHRFKYRSVVALAVEFARMLSKSLPAGGFDAVVPVPTSVLRARERGYDQAVLLAIALSTECQLPVAHLLRRLQRATPPQSGTAQEVRETRRDLAFLVERAPPARVLVVDDVITTGATMAAARRTLAACGSWSLPAAVAVTPRYDGSRDVPVRSY